MRFLVTALLALCSMGCVSQLTVLAGGTVDPLHGSRLVPGMPLAVVMDEEAGSGALQREFAKKISDRLRNAGYRIVSPDDAAGLVFFLFGTSETPLSERPNSEGERGNSSNPAGRELLSGRMVYGHQFLVTVVDAEPYRRDGTVETFWSGEAFLAKGSSRSPGKTDEQALAILELLREGALEYWGRDQKRTPIIHPMPDDGE